MIKTLVLCSLFFIVSCDSKIMWKDDFYEVHWIDSKNNVTLSRKVGDGITIGRVDAKILAVGSNQTYVVAKKIDLHTKEISYFYIEKKKDNNFLNQEEITQGPFSENRYLDLKIKLQLPEFSVSF